MSEPANTLETHQRMLQYCREETVLPSEAVVRKWKDAQNQEEECTDESGDSRSTTTTTTTINTNTREPTPTMTAAAAKGDFKEMYDQMVEANSCGVGRQNPTDNNTWKMRLAANRKKNGARQYIKFKWANAYFNKLMTEGLFYLSSKDIYNLMLQNCGTEPVPTLGRVSNLLTAKRKEIGTQYLWAHGYFNKIMKEEGRINSSGKDIHNLMLQNCGTEPVPTLYKVSNWLKAKRKEVSENKGQALCDARSYFNKLMDQGHINASTDQILTLMQQSCGGIHPAPSAKSVGEWLAAKRKEFGRRGGAEYLWATCYFNDLMETDHLHSSKTTIHAMMNHNSPDEPVPSEDTIDHWLRAAKVQRSSSLLLTSQEDAILLPHALLSNRL